MDLTRYSESPLPEAPLQELSAPQDPDIAVTALTDPAFLDAVASSSQVVFSYIRSHYMKAALHEGLHTGQDLVDNWVQRHPEAMRAALGLTPRTFLLLLQDLQERAGLSHTKYVSAGEQLAMFLYTCRQGCGVRATGERFSRSLETVAKAFKRLILLLATNPMYSYWVRQPTLLDNPSTVLMKDRRFAGWFDNCCGALDGTLLPAHVPKDKQDAYRSRKGKLQINVLAACSFDLYFTYILSGWEGSATDSRVFHNAIAQGKLHVPPGKWYLGDAGFPQLTICMTPYRSVRYHLQEWQKAATADKLPQNASELYNMRHSSARNAVERIFGVVKRIWPILGHGCEYSLYFQAKLVLAVTVLYNCVRTWDRAYLDQYITEYIPSDTKIHAGDVLRPEDDEYRALKRKKRRSGQSLLEEGDSHEIGVAMRDRLARVMWEDEWWRREDRRKAKAAAEGRRLANTMQE